MKLRKVIYICAAFILIIFVLNLDAKPRVTFGYMQNIKKDREYNYLEMILPNSFATSVNAIFDVDVKKVVELEKELKQKGRELKKNYEFGELAELSKEIGTDLFIYGSFEPVKKNEIKILLEEVIDSRLQPISRKLARLEADKGPGLTEIIGGIGYIFGIMGLAIYFKTLKNRKG